MPVIRSNDVENAGLERPPLSARQIRHLALAGDDVVGLPVVLQPDDRIDALQARFSLDKAHAVGGGEEARRAKRVMPIGSLMRPSFSSSSSVRMNMAHQALSRALSGSKIGSWLTTALRRSPNTSISSVSPTLARSVRT